MMRRVLSLLLIPLVLASQGLAFAHSHRGTTVTEPAGHAARPHVHVRGAGHHHPGDGHSHKQSHGKDSGHHSHHQGGHHEEEHAVAVGLMPPCSHDDDAVYLPETVTVRANRLSASDVGMMQGMNVSPLGNFTVSDGPRLAAASAYCQPPPLSLSGGPLYLRTLSLRL